MTRRWSPRPYKNGDEEFIFELDKSVQGKLLDREMWMTWWNWKYRFNPSGDPVIWLAESDGKIVGQYALTRARIKIANEVNSIAQSVNTLTHPAYRRQGIFETLARMAYDEAAQRGIIFIYGFPNELSYPGFIKKLGWSDLGTIRAWIIPLSVKNICKKYIHNRLLSKVFEIGSCAVLNVLYRAAKAHRTKGLIISEISSFDERADDLWLKVSKDPRIMVVRDRSYLNWRYFDIPNVKFTVYLAENDGQTLGYAVVKCEEYNGLKLGRIFDLAVPPGQENITYSLLLKVIEFFKKERADLIVYRIISNKSQYRILRKCGFINSFPIAKHARFIVRPITSNISQKVLLDSDNWFVQTGDSDAA